MSTDWLDRFAPFTPTHCVVLSVWAAMTIALVFAGRRVRDTHGGERLDRALGIVGLIAWACVNGWWLAPGQFEWGRSLPLHVCDVAAFVAPIAMFTRRRGVRAILYFWGLGLSSQGLVTPVVQVGPAHAEFWAFWINHGVIGTYAVYDLTVRGFRPTWHDSLFAVVAGIGYVAVVLPIDIVFGWNYGYIGELSPETPTIVDHLGPWPMRVLWIVLLAAGAMAAMTLPWRFGRAPSGRNANSSAGRDSPRRRA